MAKDNIFNNNPTNADYDLFILNVSKDFIRGAPSKYPIHQNIPR